jgi:hypothetical protein
MLSLCSDLKLGIGAARDNAAQCRLDGAAEIAETPRR